MKHILVVDDDKVNLVSAKKLLGDTYKVTAVTMGTQALKFLQHESVDLILLDKNMPEMDGIEVIRELKGNETTKDIPVVFLTSEIDSFTETACLEAGAMDFISKPFVPNVMLTRIAKLLERDAARKIMEKQLETIKVEASDIKMRSMKDSLTGLWNRVYTEDTVNKLLRMGIDGSLFMIDMDNFKSINDNYGHIAGDETLRMFAETLNECCKDNDILCRIGGDEFVVFVTGVTDEKTLGNLAKEIIEKLAEKLSRFGFETDTSVSIGIAQSTDGDADFNSLYNYADKSLYYVKQNGKNSYHFYSDRNHEENLRAGKIVDMEYISDMMKRSDPRKGAYLLDFDNFRHVYNFIRRFVERNERNVQTLLFTLSALGETSDYEAMERAMEILDKSIVSSLRKADVSTRYSSRQAVVVLLDASEENAIKISERIINRFKDSLSELNMDIDCQIVPLDNENKTEAGKNSTLNNGGKI